jgi:hypothetical protein
MAGSRWRSRGVLLLLLLAGVNRFVLTERLRDPARPLTHR